MAIQTIMHGVDVLQKGRLLVCVLIITLWSGFDLVNSQAVQQVVTVGDGNEETRRGPNYVGTNLSLTGTYQFETILLANEINLDADGLLKSIEFYTSASLNVSLVSGFNLYLKTTEEESLEDGNISSPSNEGYTSISGNVTVLSLGIGSNGFRFELDEGFPVEEGTNLGIHTRSADLLQINEGQYLATSISQDLVKASLPGVLAWRDMTLTSLRPNVSLEFELEIDPGESGVEAEPDSILADGSSSSEIVVTLRYANGEQVPVGGTDVFLETTAGALGSITDNGDGTYTASLTSSTSEETATVTAYLGEDNQGELIGTATVDFIAPVFYSRQSGNWPDTTTWTLNGTHNGDPVPRAPEPGDRMIIGGNHTVSLTGDEVNDESVEVKSTGTLHAGTYVLSGGGDFTLESGGTLVIGSPDGISSSGSAGNIQVNGNIEYSSGANYIYNGTAAQTTGGGLPVTVNNLTIDNTEGVTALSDHRIEGDLTLANGNLVMPEGAGLVAENSRITGSGAVTMQRRIDGSKGWRMIASPVATDYGDLTGGDFVTQGFSGSDFPNRQSNLLWFDETDGGTTLQGWRQPGSISDPVAAGRGHLHYIFDGAGYDDGSGNYADGLPMTLTATGTEHSFTGGSFSYEVTFTERNAGASQSGEEWTDINEADEGWNLLGNPTMATLDWEHSGWTKTNVSPSIYIWDPAANGGNGDYLVWNGVSGTPENGRIAPFQAFWVVATGENPELSFTNEVKTTGGEFVGGGVEKTAPEQTRETKPAVITLRLNSRGLDTRAYVSLMDEGKTGRDRWDAYRLQPLSNTWLALSTSPPENGPPLAINNLPFPAENEEYRIPLYVGGVEEGRAFGDRFLLEWELPEDWPEEITATLMDHEAGEAIPMRGRNEYRFEHQTPERIGESGMGRFSAAKENAEESSSGTRPEPDLPGSILFQKGKVVPQTMKTGSRNHTRFTIVLSRTENSGTYLPDEVQLRQNYPNPFNPETTIRFTLPARTEVTLEVYDLLGRRVATLVNNRSLAAGDHRAVWDGSRHASGTYLYRLTTPKSTLTQKMVLMK